MGKAKTLEEIIAGAGGGYADRDYTFREWAKGVDAELKTLRESVKRADTACRIRHDEIGCSICGKAGGVHKGAPCPLCAEET